MTRVLIFFFQHGGVNALAPLIADLDRQYDLVVAGLPIVESDARDLGIPFVSFDPGRQEDGRQAFRAFLERQAPDVLVADTLDLARVAAGPLYQKLWAAARDLSIPSIAYIDCWWGYDRRFWLDDAGCPQHDLPDTIAVVDDFAREEAIREGLAPERIRVLGNPRFATLSDRSGDTHRFRSAREAAKLSPGTTLITFVSQPLTQLDVPSSVYDYDEISTFTEILDALASLPPDIRDNLEIAALVHPLEDPRGLSAIADAHSLAGQVRVYKGPAALDLVADSVVVLGMSSMLLVDAVVLDRPLISVQLDAREDAILITNKIGATRPIRSRTELKEVLGRVLSDAGFRDSLRERQSRFHWIRNAKERWLGAIRDVSEVTDSPQLQPINLSAALAGLDPQPRYRRYRELWEQAEAFRILTDFPLHLDLELAGVCNLRCEDCFQNGLITHKLGLMEPSLFQRIIDEGAEAGLCAVKLQVRGESLLHPRFFDCVSYAKERGIRDIQVTTNGTELTDDVIENILDSGLTEVLLSVDNHHSQATAAKNIPYSEVETKIVHLLTRRRERGQTAPQLRLVSSMGSQSAADLEERRVHLQDRFPDADWIVVSRLHNFRNDVPAFPNLHTDYRLNPCHYLTTRMSVFWDGQVTACCVDFNNEFRFGNAGGESIREIWNSDTVTAFRLRHLQGLRPELPICKNCPTNVTPLDSASRPGIPRSIADRRTNRAFGPLAPAIGNGKPF